MDNIIQSLKYGAAGNFFILIFNTVLLSRKYINQKKTGRHFRLGQHCDKFGMLFVEIRQMLTKNKSSSSVVITCS